MNRVTYRALARPLKTRLAKEKRRAFAADHAGDVDRRTFHSREAQRLEGYLSRLAARRKALA